MIEVFRTNVDDPLKAASLIEQIQNTFSDHTASFDLEDCDRILVVKCRTGDVQSSQVMGLLKRLDYDVEILP